MLSCPWTHEYVLILTCNSYTHQQPMCDDAAGRSGLDPAVLVSRAESTTQPDKAYTAISTGEYGVRMMSERRDYVDDLLSMSMLGRVGRS